VKHAACNTGEEPRSQIMLNPNHSLPTRALLLTLAAPYPPLFPNPNTRFTRSAAYTRRELSHGLDLLC